MTTQFIVFDDFWQTPAKTELHAFERLKAYNWMAASFKYVAFPWATLIDYFHTGREIPKSLLDGYTKIQKEAKLAAADNVLITVCQHIYAFKYINLFKTCGIKRIYWSHCTLDYPSIGEIEIRPFPLYAVQTLSQDSTKSIPSSKTRSYKASFIGAYNRKYYQTRIREEILGLKELYRDDYIIIARENWHYEEEVYGQIKGNMLGAELRNKKLNHAEEYKQVLMNSTFSLCPSGSGPNSIRLWESLTFDTIPIIFSDRLALPGDVQDWIEAAVFMSEFATRDDIMRLIDRHGSQSQFELEEKREAIRNIREKYGNSCFVWDILVDTKFIKEQATDAKQKKDIQKDKNALCSHINVKIKEHLTLIIDPGLKDRGSHHDKINRSISNKLQGVTVISHQMSSIDASKFTYPVRSAFKTSIYDEDSAITPIKYHGIIRSFTKTLVRELKAFENTSSIYIHSATPSLIHSLAMALRIRENSLCNLQLIYLQLMFGPYSLISNPKMLRSSLPKIRFAAALKALDTVCKNRNIHLSIDTSNAIFCDQFSQLTASNSIGIHPHVFSHGNTEGNNKLQTHGPILLHSGDCRPGKGLEWLGDCLEVLIRKSPAEAKFVIHTGTLRYPDAYPTIKLALKKIKEVTAGYRDRVNLLEGRVNDNDWESMFAQCSRIYLLHDPRYYRHKTSGNFFDAISVKNGGVPLYLTKNTLSSLVAQKEGLTFGHIVYNNTRSLIESVSKFPTHPTYFGVGYKKFASTSINIDHASYVMRKLYYYPLDEMLK
jgi:hypothetical protein